MSLACKAGWHKPAPIERWNDGHYFGQCARCGRDLIRAAAGEWKPVPKGYRVAWRPRTENDIDWSAWERSNAAVIQDNSTGPMGKEAPSVPEAAAGTPVVPLHRAEAEPTWRPLPRRFAAG